MTEIMATLGLKLCSNDGLSPHLHSRLTYLDGPLQKPDESWWTAMNQQKLNQVEASIVLTVPNVVIFTRGN